MIVRVLRVGFRVWRLGNGGLGLGFRCGVTDRLYGSGLGVLVQVRVRIVRVRVFVPV
jgi:hypothetical protein